MEIKNTKTYDVLKYISRYFLPALGVLYVALADTWQLPLSVQVSATISAVILFINTLLGISNENHNRENKDE